MLSGKTYAGGAGNCPIKNEYTEMPLKNQWDLHNVLAKWIKQYSAVRLDDDTLITAEQTLDAP